MAKTLMQLFNTRLNAPGLKEAIAEPLYDFISYDSGATTSLKFFSEQIGVNGKTKHDTNMQASSSLSKGNKFVAMSMEIHVLPGSSASSYVRQDPIKTATALGAPNFANDVWALLNKGYAEITIGSKPYLTAPLLAFPAQSGLLISAAAAVENTNTTVQNQITADYARLVGKPFRFEPELPLDENTNFDVTLFWPAAVTLPSGFDARIGVVLQGMRFRN